MGCSGGSSSDEPQGASIPEEVVEPDVDRDPKAIYLHEKNANNDLRESMPFKSSFFLNTDPYKMLIVNDDPVKNPIKAITIDGPNSSDYDVKSCLQEGKDFLAHNEKCLIYVSIKSKPGLWKEEKKDTVNLLFTYEDKKTLTMPLDFDYKPIHATILSPGDSEVDKSNYFGWNIATLDNQGKKIIAVGAPGKPAPQGEEDAPGKVYLYEKENDNFKITQTINVPETTSDKDLLSKFGQNVHLETVSDETFLFVSDYNNLMQPINENAKEIVYVYSKDSNGQFILRQEIEKPEDNPSKTNFFGHSIVYNKGRLYIGAYGPVVKNQLNDSSWEIVRQDFGSVYVFNFDSKSKEDPFHYRMTLSDPNKDKGLSGFGYSLAIDKEKNRLVVGSPLMADAGSAFYVYDVNTLKEGSQPQIAYKSKSASADMFASSLIFENNELFVGASVTEENGEKKKTGAVYRFTLNDSNAELIQKISPSNGESDDWFGGSLSLYNNDYLLIGAYGKDKNPEHSGDNKINNGSVYLYKRNGETFDYVENVFTDEDFLGKGNDKTTEKTYFGYSIVSIKDSLAVISADGDGEVAGFVVVID